MENSLAKEYYANGDVYYHAWRMGIYLVIEIGHSQPNMWVKMRHSSYKNKKDLR